MTQQTCEAVDPRTGETIAQYDEATAADVDAAAEQAAKAAVDARLKDHARRAGALRNTAQRLRAQQDAITAVCTRETGLPEARVHTELARTCNQIDLFAGMIERGEHLEAIIDHADPGTVPPRPDLRRTLVPIGPVAVFGASNFPLAFSTFGGDTASALAAGCPVVVKGHPGHPGTGELVARAAQAALGEAGLPAGAFGHVLAAAHELAGRLVEHPAITAVAFTGSLRGGRALMARAARRPDPIPVHAEMGSLNPIVVTDRALQQRGEAIATGLVRSVCDFGGQLCTKPGLVLVPGTPAGDAFARALAQAVEARDPEVLLGAPIASAFAHGLEALPASVERLTAAGATPERGAWGRPVAYQAPLHALTDVPALREEHFGPAIVVLRYAELADVPAALAQLGGQLSWTLHSEPGDAVDAVLETATRNAGRVVFNGFPTGVAVSWATQHGGPWPATSSPTTTSVGLTAVRRFLRPVTYQDAPRHLLPPELSDENPLGIVRRVDGVLA